MSEAPSQRPRLPPIRLTPRAAARVKALMAQRATPTAGLRIGVRSGGCAGFRYTIEFADAREPEDRVITVEDLTILIDPKAELFLFGSEMDFVEDVMQSGFVFRNPNAQGRCGCGESFRV